MAKVFGASGVKGIDVQTESGTTSYNADKSGLISIDNPKHLRQAIAEGMVIASDASFANAPGYQCSACSFVSLFKAFDCPKCGVKNDYRD